MPGDPVEEMVRGKEVEWKWGGVEGGDLGWGLDN